MCLRDGKVVFMPIYEMPLIPLYKTNYELQALIYSLSVVSSHFTVHYSTMMLKD